MALAAAATTAVPLWQLVLASAGVASFVAGIVHVVEGVLARRHEGRREARARMREAFAEALAAVFALDRLTGDSRAQYAPWANPEMTDEERVAHERFERAMAAIHIGLDKVPDELRKDVGRINSEDLAKAAHKYLK